MGAWHNGIYLGRITHVHAETADKALVTIRPLGDKDFQTWINTDDVKEMA